MPFYTYSQNNSGGSFVVTDNLANYVIIEAADPKEADYKLTRLGGYFDGCAKGNDCECCGDRWYPQDTPWSDNEGYSEPSYYGMSLEEYSTKERKRIKWTNPSIIIHYSDGRKESIE